MQGHRKFILGLAFIIGGFVLLGVALFTDKDAAVIGSLAASFVSVATGLGVVIYGNVMEHRTKAGNDGNK